MQVLIHAGIKVKPCQWKGTLALKTYSSMDLIFYEYYGSDLQLSWPIDPGQRPFKIYTNPKESHCTMSLKIPLAVSQHQFG